MLILSRKLEESILVDGKAKITILQIKGGKVRVGVDAPDDVRILRADLATQQFVPNQELQDDAPVKSFTPAHG